MPPRSPFPHVSILNQYQNLRTRAYSSQTQSRAPHCSHPTSLPPLLLHVLRLLLIPSVLLLRVAPLVRILLRIAALLAIPTTILLRLLLLMGFPKEFAQKSFRAARLLLLSRWKRLLAVAAWRDMAGLTVGRLIATSIVVVRGATVHCACCALVFFRLEFAGETLIFLGCVRVGSCGGGCTIRACTIGVIRGQAALFCTNILCTCAADVTRRCARWCNVVGRRVDGLGRLLPLRALGICVYIEPFRVLIWMLTLVGARWVKQTGPDRSTELSNLQALLAVEGPPVVRSQPCRHAASRCRANDLMFTYVGNLSSVEVSIVSRVVKG